MDEFKGDEDILDKMITIYLQKSEHYFTDLADLIKEQKLEDIKHLSHQFKGAISNFTIDSPFKTLREIESLAKAGQLEAMTPLMDSLKSQLVTLDNALKELKMQLQT